LYILPRASTETGGAPRDGAIIMNQKRHRQRAMKLIIEHEAFRPLPFFLILNGSETNAHTAGFIRAFAADGKLCLMNIKRADGQRPSGIVRYKSLSFL
jgi:hypothetical protein